MTTTEEQIVLSEDAVYDIIAANPESISRDSLAHHFRITNGTGVVLDDLLTSMVRAQKIMRAPENPSRFQAPKPLSDLVVARVGKRVLKGRVPLTIENLNTNLDITVTISDKQARTYRLKETEKIAVILERHKGSELKAKFIDRFNRYGKMAVVGKFKEKTGPNAFYPLDRRIRTVFKAAGQLPAEIDSRVPYYAEIGTRLNPHDPEVTIGEQKWDPVTGSRIYDVIGSNHGLRHRHEKPAGREARKMAASVIRRLSSHGLRNLSESPILVVDPQDARDHDDGILVQRIQGGFYTLAVVADVPRFVRSDTLLDEAARARGFSHYFPDETFHMLPPVLGANACSLMEGKLRPVVYVEQLRDVDGTPYHTDIGLGYIKSQRQLTYSQFQMFLASDHPDAKAYNELQNAIGVQRYNEEIMMESTSTEHRYGDAQLIVQALMVDANKAMADFLDHKNIPFLRRTHAGHVNPLAYREISEEFKAKGYVIPDNVEDLTPAYINGLVGEATLRGEKEQISSMIRLRLLEPAIFSTRALGHWGLSAIQYGHFTSPIRRYGDIINLRAIHTAVSNDGYGLSRNDEENMDRIANNLNHLQIVNRTVQHETQRYYAVKDLHRNENNSVMATLLSVRPGSIELFLPAYGLRKLIAASSLPAGWRQTENGKGITDGAIAIVEGARLRVKITDVQPHKAFWDIGSIEPVKGHKMPLKRSKTLPSQGLADPKAQIA